MDEQERLMGRMPECRGHMDVNERLMGRMPECRHHMDKQERLRHFPLFYIQHLTHTNFSKAHQQRFLIDVLLTGIY